MTKMSKTSSVHKRRMHYDYVERNHRVTNTDTIDRINPVDPIENRTDFSSSNYLIASDVFYDKLKQLSDEYRKFYHNERSLEKAIGKIDSNKELLAEHMKELIYKYNKTIVSLKRIDSYFNTRYMYEISQILSRYENELRRVGIKKIDDEQLEIDINYFVENIVNSEDAISKLFKPVRAMITILYKTFKSIKIPNKSTLEQEYNEYEEFSVNDYNGLILDKKS